jgi:PadR family transcriptional regulator AphA
MSRPETLSTTSYAVLSLLSVQPWSTYELTRQMDRSLGRVWPRARSKLYEEPKKLVRLGLAAADAERVGRRGRTVYRITDEGRRALTGWHRATCQGPVLEFEHLLKMMFAENGTRADALGQLEDVRAWARERNEGNLEAARAYAAGSGPFQERAARTMLAGAFLTDFYALVDRWAEWATEVVERWPEDPGAAVADPEVLREILRRAEWSEAAMMQP